MTFAALRLHGVLSLWRSRSKAEMARRGITSIAQHSIDGDKRRYGMEI